MKLSLLLTIVTVFQFSASGHAQQVTLSFKKEPLENVIKSITKQTGYAFFYDIEYIKSAKPITVNLKNVSVKEALAKVLENQDLTWELLEKTILIKPIFKSKSPHKNIDVKGKVVDKEDLPIPGVSIRIKETQSGTITDESGSFLLKSIGTQTTLIISSTGYLTQEIAVAERNQINVTLLESSQSLNELVVIGYGTQLKKDLTGAVSSVKTDDIVMSQGPEIGSMLKGKVSGLTVQQNSAQPGGGLNILVRGAGSVRASNSPLFVIDGFPISDLQQPGSGNDYDGGTQSILNSFNPNDIESIEVLKDASATSIYGSRAANGVILITSKRGTENTAKINYNNNFSWQLYDNSFDVLPLNEWMQVSNDASYENWMWENQIFPYGIKSVDQAKIDVENGVISAYQRPYSQNAINNVGKGTNWFDEVMRNGSTQQHNISVYGGNKRTKYLISGNFYDQDGIIKNSGFKRYSFRANIDQELNKFVKMGVNLATSRISNQNTQLGGQQFEKAGIIRMALQMGPQIPVMDEDGNYSRNPTSPLQPNPASMITISDDGRIERVLLNSFLDITPIQNLTIKLKAGIDRGLTRRMTYLPRTTIHGELANGRASISNFDRDDYLLEATANYTKTYGKGHKFELLGGVSQQKINQRNSGSIAAGFTTDAFLWNNMNAGSLQLGANSYASKNMMASYFVRLNYNFNSRYLFTFTIRTDGASVFAKNHKWGTFPSAAVAWDIMQEPFLKNWSNVSQLKLRFSYGQTGNASIGNNAFAAYTAYPGWLSGSDSRLIATSLARLENPDLKWETTTGANLGLDYSLFKGKVEGSIELFNNIISDLLDRKPLNSYHEIDTVWSNIGKTRSRGIEVSLTTRNIQRKDFQWKTNANFSLYRDTWLERSPDWKPFIYQNDKDPIRPMYYLLSDGILQIGEQAPNAQNVAGMTLKPGQIKIKDINGFARDISGNPRVDANGRFLKTGKPDGIIDDADYALLGSSDPGYMVGITNIISYKNFSLNFDFNGLLKRRMIDPNYFIYGYSAWGIAIQGYNALSSVKDRWTPTNPSTTIPGTYASYYNYGLGDFFMQDAWFIRLQNVALGYELPKKWTSKFFSSAKINLAAHNVFVISPYKGVDPETDSYTAAYPNIRTYTAGFNFTF